MPSPYGYEASFEMAITAAIIFTSFIVILTMQMIKYRAWFWNTAIQAAVGMVVLSLQGAKAYSVLVTGIIFWARVANILEPKLMTAFILQMTIGGYVHYA